jgi:signal transduction histidine kinase
VLASSLFKPSTAELHAANSCALNALKRPQSHEISPQDAKRFIDLLRPPLGDDAARREVEQALNDLSLDADETRPQALRELRNQLEVNLSALLGPVEAFRILSHHSTEATNETYRAKDIHILENHLENYQTRLTGLAAELDQLRRYHRHTLQKLPIGVCSLSPDLEVLMWNSDMEQFTGIEQTSTLGKSLRELPQPWNDLLVNFANQEHPHLSNQKIIFEGRPRRFNMHKAVLDEQTATTSSPQVLLVEDQTETQLLTDKLVHSERLASIGRLAAGVAHEIGNPITGIDCLAQNLKYETDNPEVLEAADLILLQTERVTRIVQSLVNFAHSGSHTQHIEHIPLNLNDCIEQAIGLVRLDARGKQQLFENNCDPDLDVIGDTHQLLQVFINLFNNAADASSATDPIRIETAAGEDSIEVSVIDSGCGIDPELQERLFEPFFTTKEPGKGTGLGLSLVYSIIEEHYGNIAVESPAYKDQNKGTKFIVTLPLVNNQPSLPENHPG